MEQDATTHGAPAPCRWTFGDLRCPLPGIYRHGRSGAWYCEHHRHCNDPEEGRRIIEDLLAGRDPNVRYAHARRRGAQQLAALRQRLDAAPDAPPSPYPEEPERTAGGTVEDVMATAVRIYRERRQYLETKKGLTRQQAHEAAIGWVAHVFCSQGGIATR